MDFPTRYHAFILEIGAATGMPDPLLHVHAGLVILLLVRLATRHGLGSFIPFAVVVVAELGNELMDHLAYQPLLGDTLADIANTLFWPFVISLGVRLRPMLRPERRPS